MNTEDKQKRIKSYELAYKFFLGFGALVLLDTFLKPLGFALVSYAFFFVLRAFLPAESIYGWVGLFGMSWIIWFTLAAGFKRRSKAIQKELEAQKPGASVENKII